MSLTNSELSQYPERRELRMRYLGLKDYVRTWREMQRFTAQRTPDTIDEVWMVQHPPVFTLGQAGRIEHLIKPGDIPVIKVDRGGQVTYHGPGQLVMYVLLNLPRAGLGIRTLVGKLERSVIELLADYDITATARRDAPGVYVGEQKIAAIGLRVRRQCTFHGLSLNVDMDLEPFGRINPCGYPGLKVTQLSVLGGPTKLDLVGRELIAHLGRLLDYRVVVHDKLEG